jgi:hypothetical protein
MPDAKRPQFIGEIQEITQKLTEHIETLDVKTSLFSLEHISGHTYRVTVFDIADELTKGVSGWEGNDKDA